MVDDRGLAYEFHNYKKQGADKDVLKQAIEEHGWERVINRRGTTWRQLPSAVKAGMNDETAIKVAGEQPSLIKRPLLLRLGETYLGFDPKLYKDIF